MIKKYITPPKHTCVEARKLKVSLNELKKELDDCCGTLGCLMTLLQDARSELKLSIAEDYGIYTLLTAAQKHQNSIMGIAQNVMHRKLTYNKKVK